MPIKYSDTIEHIINLVLVLLIASGHDLLSSDLFRSVPFRSAQRIQKSIRIHALGCLVFCSTYAGAGRQTAEAKDPHEGQWKIEADLRGSQNTRPQVCAAQWPMVIVLGCFLTFMYFANVFCCSFGTIIPWD